MTDTDPHAPPPPIPDELAAEPVEPPPTLTDDSAGERVVPPPAWSDLYPAGTAARPRRRRPSAVQLGSGVLLIIFGGIWLLQATGAIDISISAVLPAALILLGGLLIVGSRTGRHTGLIVAGVVLSLVTAVISSVDIRLEGGIGERVDRPASAADIDADYRLAFGSLEVDLSGVDFSAPVTLPISVGVGELIVLLPAETAVQITAHAGVGEIVLFGEDTRGLDVDAEKSEGIGPIVALELEVGIGSIEVRRVAGSVQA